MYHICEATRMLCGCSVQKTELAQKIHVMEGMMWLEWFGYPGGLCPLIAA